MGATKAGKAPQDAPEAEGRTITVTLAATAAEARELALAAAIAGEKRGPWVLRIALEAARPITAEWAANHVDDGA